MATFTPRQKNWRWAANNSATDPTPLANENAEATLTNNDDIIHLRFTFAEIGGKADTTVAVAMQYSLNSDMSSPVAFGAAPAHWNYANGVGTEGSNVSGASLLSDDSSFGEYCESGSNSLSVGANALMEVDFAIQATSAVSRTTRYYFQCVQQSVALALDTGETYPYLTTAGLNYTYTGAVSAAGTLASTRAVTKGIAGTVAAIATAASTRSILKKVASTVSPYSANGWESTTSLEKTIVGAVSAQATISSVRTVEKTVAGTLSAEATAASAMDFEAGGGGLLDYTWTGAVAAQAYLEHGRTVERVIVGALGAEGTLASDRSVEKGFEGEIAAAFTFASERSIEITVAGAIAAEAQWSSTWDYEIEGALDFTWEGTLSADATVASTRTVERTIDGGVSAAATIESTRAIERNIAGGVAATATASSARSIRKKFSVTVEPYSASGWQSTVSKQGRQYEWVGGISAAATVQSVVTLSPLRVFGGVTATITAAARRSVAVTLPIGVSATRTFASTRSIHKKVTDTISPYSDGWQSTVSKEVGQYVSGGGIIAEATMASQVTFWPLRVTGNVSVEGTWESTEEYAITEGLHVGSASAEITVIAGKSFSPGILAEPGLAGIEAEPGYPGMAFPAPALAHVHLGGLLAWTNWQSAYSRESEISFSLNYTHQGALSATATAGATRTIEKTSAGRVAATGTWASGRSREKTYAGDVAAEITLAAGMSETYRIVLQYQGDIAAQFILASRAFFVHEHVSLAFTHVGGISAEFTVQASIPGQVTFVGGLSAEFIIDSVGTGMPLDTTKYGLRSVPAGTWVLTLKPAYLGTTDGALTDPAADGAYSESGMDGALTDPLGDMYAVKIVPAGTTWTLRPRG